MRIADLINVISWYWIIGAALLAWAFLSILSGEMQTRINESEAKRAAELAAKAENPESETPPINKPVAAVR